MSQVQGHNWADLCPDSNLMVDTWYLLFSSIIKNSNLLPAFCPQASIPIGIKAELHNRDVAPTDLPARVGIYPLIYQGLRATHLPPQC